MGGAHRPQGAGASLTEASMDEVRPFPPPVTQNGACAAQVTPPSSTRPTGGRATFVTIATPDRAAQSRIFARSARECHPDARVVVFTPENDGPPGMFDDLYDLVISAEQLSLSGLADMRFRYTTSGLCFALKAWAIRHLLEKFPDDPIYYFDSDIELFTPLTEVEAALAHGANLVLTPHILQPAPDQDSEMALLRSGSLNAGFLAVAPSAAARAFVAWWCDRVRAGCSGDPPGDNHRDQKWLELAPSICDGVTVLRHPGYNFAYWNAYERPLIRRGGAWTAAGLPLRFVHYSQWDWREQDWEQYLARYFHREYQPFAGLFADYQKKLQGEDRFGETRAARVYGEILAPCGTPIPDLLRSAYERHGPAVDGNASEVFACAVSVLNAQSPTRAELSGLPMTALYGEVWERHADLRYRFDVDRADGRLAFLRWLVEAAATELEIPAAFMAPAQSALESERRRRIETGDAPAAAPTAFADPGLPRLPDAPETIAALIAARDAERDRLSRQDDHIRLLVGSNQALRREAHALRVQSGREEETIQALDKELAQAKRARNSAMRHGRRLAGEIAVLRTRRSYGFTGWLGARPRVAGTGCVRQPVLAGEGPFFQRGFLLGDAAAITGTTVRRIKTAPSGMLIFGPYVTVPAGTYSVTLDARLYQRLLALSGFKVDVVCDESRQIVGSRWFRLHSLARWRRFELIFTVWEDQVFADFEVRIWARRGTPLEIGAIELHRLAAEPPAGGAPSP
jgi:hypothetical protein